MKRLTPILKFGFLFSCILYALRPVHAAGQCAAATQKNLTTLNPIQIVSQIADIRVKDRTTVQSYQRCLAVRGCYAKDPKEIDGIVGPYTTAALYRSVYDGCLSVQPVKPACGDGQEPYSFYLTAANVQALIKPTPPQLNSDDEDTSARDNAPEEEPVPLSQPLQDGLKTMQGSDYPDRDLFWNALSFFAQQKLTGADTPPAKQAVTDLNKELAANKTEILDTACKPHSPLDVGEGWSPDWNANMIYSLSSPVYGFYPFWIADPAPADAETNAPHSPPADTSKSSSNAPANKQAAAPPQPIDFGVFQRIGWTGVTFTQDGNLQLDLLHKNADNISRQIELARRFRTSVDLVVYKDLSQADWIDLAYTNSASFVDTLSQSIADTVGQHQAGFLNNMQYWALPSVLASPTTAWDGVTLDLINFPYSDPVAMKFLTNLLTHLRQALQSKEERKSAWGKKTHPLDLNLVVPFDVFVPAAGTPADTAVQQDTTVHLAQFVPKAPCYLYSGKPCDREASIVDSFIVFLPQSNGSINNQGTGVTKKQLRQTVENALDHSPYILQLLHDDQSIHIAAWRYEMLRRITYILEPSTWSYVGDYAQPGGQFFDDMIYAEDNFDAVGFWPLPDYTADHAEIAKFTRRIFIDENSAKKGVFADFVERRIGIPAANFFGGWRRELAFAVETVFASLALYTLLAFWVIPLRSFYNRHAWVLYALALLGVVVLVLLCLFDSALRDFANIVFFALTVVAVGMLVARQYLLRKIEKDLP